MLYLVHPSSCDNHGIISKEIDLFLMIQKISLTSARAITIGDLSKARRPNSASRRGKPQCERCEQQRKRSVGKTSAQIPGASRRTGTRFLQITLCLARVYQNVRSGRGCIQCSFVAVPRWSINTSLQIVLLMLLVAAQANAFLPWLEEGGC